MGKLNYVAIGVLAIFLAGCGTRVSLRSELDPNYAPQLSDPVAIVLPDNSSITERQVLPVLKQQMVASGFRLTDEKKAKWILGFSTQRETKFQGLSSSSFAVNIGYGVSVGGGSSKAKYGTSMDLQFWLFDAKQYRQGKFQAIWHYVEVIHDADDFLDQPKFYLHPLLVIYGLNFHDDSVRPNHIDRDDASGM